MMCISSLLLCLFLFSTLELAQRQSAPHTRFSLQWKTLSFSCLRSPPLCLSAALRASRRRCVCRSPPERALLWEFKSMRGRKDGVEKLSSYTTLLVLHFDTTETDVLYSTTRAVCGSTVLMSSYLEPFSNGRRLQFSILHPPSSVPG